MNYSPAAAVFAIAAICVFPSHAQLIPDGAAGAINYSEGRVLLDGRQLSASSSVFNFVQSNGELRTESGMAEVLMNPGAFVRLGRESAIRMLSVTPSDAVASLSSGAVIVEVVEVPKKGAFTLAFGNATASFVKAGNARFDANPPSVRVFSGTVRVQVIGRKSPIEVSAGRMLALGGAKLSTAKFDQAWGELETWSASRSRVLMGASLLAADLRSNDYLGSGRPVIDSCSGWSWSRWPGVWTYIPCAERICDQWAGVCYYSIARIWKDSHSRWYTGVDSAGGSNSGGNSAPTVPETSSGSSGVMAASTVAAASPSAGTGATAAATAASSAAGTGSASAGARGR